MSKQFAFSIRPMAIGAVTAIVTGGGAVLLAWYHMGNTDQVWIQNQEIAGCLLGLGLIVLGSALVIRDGIVRSAELRFSPAVQVEVASNGNHDAAAAKPRAKAARARVSAAVDQ